MRSAIIAEFRKLFSVRSTYVMSALALLLVGGGFFYASLSAEAAALQPEYLAGQVLAGVNFMTIFVALVALLLVTHEYRYNTIMYTLTTSNSRTKVFIAKLVVVSLYAAMLAILVGLLAPAVSYLGTQIKGFELAPQTFKYVDLLWRSVFVSFGNALAALILAFIIRNQVGAIATFFVVINMLEGLLSIFLKERSVYLPFSALQQVVAVTVRSGEAEAVALSGQLSPTKGAFVFGLYMIFGLVVAWLLFLRRDAN